MLRATGQVVADDGGVEILAAIQSVDILTFLNGADWLHDVICVDVPASAALQVNDLNPGVSTSEPAYIPASPLEPLAVLARRGFDGFTATKQVHDGFPGMPAPAQQDTDYRDA